MPFWHSACDRSTRTAAGEHGFRPALERILTLDFLDRSENLILVGAHGLGKTMLAKNIAHQAVLAGHTALFTTAADPAARPQRAGDRTRARTPAAPLHAARAIGRRLILMLSDR